MSGEDNINNNSTDNGFWTSTKRGTEEITIQQKKLQRIDADAKGAHHEQTQHMLNMIMADPEKLKRDEFDYLRQFLATVIHNLDKFKFDIGDDRGTVALDDKENKSKLTIGYIDCVARRKDTSSLAKEPILQVVERETKYRNSINVNIYSICGKKHRMKLPDCLVNAVRTAYPEESGIYEGFCFNTE